jgi:maltose alpha-D-glucosyltransferase/alpha-amylase
LPEEVRPAVDALLARSPELLARVNELTSEPVDALRIRRHGNLHLGKVLLVADDFLITGFEGDVSLPIEERRRKDSALYDVAMVLRSLDDVRLVAMERALGGRPDLRERFEPALAEWLRATREAFLDGYRRGVGDARCVPASAEETARLLTLFEIAVAVRELSHGVESRPAWLSAPAAALVELIGA